MDNYQLNRNNPGRNNCLHKQEMHNNYFTNKFEEILKRNGPSKNVNSLYCENITKDIRYQSDSDEEYEIFKVDSSSASNDGRIYNSTSTCVLPNGQQLESGINLNCLHFKNSTNYFQNSNKDCQTLIENFNYYYLFNNILSVMSEDCFHTGISQTEIVEPLRNTKFPGNAVSALQQDIELFFNYAVHAGIIKKRGSRFYLQVVDDAEIQRNSLKRKTENENSNFTKHSLKVNDNTVERRNDDERSELMAEHFGPSTSKDERRMNNTKPGIIASVKGTKNQQNDTAYYDVREVFNVEILEPNSENVLNNTYIETMQTSKKIDKVTKIRKIDLKTQTVLNMIDIAKSRRGSVKKMFT